MTAYTFPTDDRPARWGAVFALTLCVSTLIASEFMPVSLLTPVAADLQVTEGQAGQAIAVSGLFAVLTSLLIATVSRGVDRRRLLLGLTGLMLASGLIVALAPSYAVLMVGRAMLGVVIGGFWSLSTAVVMQLVPAKDLPKGLALLNGGNALATTIAAPLGSFLGQFIGWRGAFFIVVPLAAIVLVWQFLSLPSMPSDRRATRANALALLRRREAAIGIAGVTLLFMGQFALFTYLRPFLETTTGVSVSVLSLILLIMGLAGAVGSALIPKLIARSLRTALVAAPTGLAVIGLALIGLGRDGLATGILLALWGLVGTAAPVAWWTWLSRTLPDDAEAGGGLMVAAIQLAITLGAAAGGLLFDAGGYRATFGASALILLAAAAVSSIAPLSDRSADAAARTTA
ncbi:MFS transporter [Brevundimonas sp.]|uniref:MFS transporter n=1 Tax=Brevundimonas sp. TaxID=1871086 RepID=UPI001840E0B3|nr:MFS transporter [Brevundimonas sp.]MBA4806327.1 MFS transporter [Brevundimonas sp.]